MPRAILAKTHAWLVATGPARWVRRHERVGSAQQEQQATHVDAIANAPWDAGSIPAASTIGHLRDHRKWPFSLGLRRFAVVSWAFRAVEVADKVADKAPESGR